MVHAAFDGALVAVLPCGLVLLQAHQHWHLKGVWHACCMPWCRWVSTALCLWHDMHAIWACVARCLHKPSSVSSVGCAIGTRHSSYSCSIVRNAAMSSSSMRRVASSPRVWLDGDAVARNKGNRLVLRSSHLTLDIADGSMMRPKSCNLHKWLSQGPDFADLSPARNCWTHRAQTMACLGAVKSVVTGAACCSATEPCQLLGHGCCLCLHLCAALWRAALLQPP